MSGLSFGEDYKNSELPSSNTSTDPAAFQIHQPHNYNHQTSEPRPESIQLRGYPSTTTIQYHYLFRHHGANTKRGRETSSNPSSFIRMQQVDCHTTSYGHSSVNGMQQVKFDTTTYRHSTFNGIRQNDFHATSCGHPSINAMRQVDFDATSYGLNPRNLGLFSRPYISTGTLSDMQRHVRGHLCQSATMTGQV